MKRRAFVQLTGAVAVTSMGAGALPTRKEKPNVLIIHTDEHSFRTLGCYRELLSEDQAFVWGKGVKVDTPNLDALAKEGALCTNYYASSPVCTPSRASFVSGLYPIATGAPSNDEPLNDNIVTFAEVFRQNGYATSYLGKWHLDGEDRPGYAPERQFGFSDNRYMINRGHWKNLMDTPNGLQVRSQKNGQPSYDIGDADEKSYTTDFLTDRTISVIERDKHQPFCVMLAIPDPHGPDTVRRPYDDMFKSLHFEKPRSMTVSESSMPAWVKRKGMLKEMEQHRFQAYFGMVKCIDDNVGKLLKYLQQQGLDQNTIVIFTADHGDLLGEHKRWNKGLPFETSAKIPFIIRYPEKIPAGKIIRTPHCNTDFAPMILSMAGISKGWPAFHGKNTAPEFLSPDKEISEERMVYSSHAGNNWVSAMDGRHKLVLSHMDSPWLFDLEKDPDEIVNVYGDPDYKLVAQRLREELMSQLKRYKDPILEDAGFPKES